MVGRIILRGDILACAALALLMLVVPGTGKPDRVVSMSAFSEYFAVRAERLCFSGDCPCFVEPYRTQCFAERKSSFDRDNPPRGELTGVCWAAQGKWERDPQSDKQVYRVRYPVYSRVRFNEAKTLSKYARDDRDAGFEVEVGEAWQRFVQATAAAEHPATDGWSWTNRCVSLDRPRRTEDQEWSRAQEQVSYERVFLPQYGIADTPEERALEARARREREGRLAEEKRIADAKAAAEARAKAEAEAKRRAEVASMEAQLGAGKRAAAERLLAMNAEVAKYRPKPPPSAAAKSAPKPSPTLAPPRQCARRQGTGPVSYTASTRAAAEAGVARARATPGGSESMLQSSVGAATCTQRNEIALKPPPVGTCLSCVSEQMATNLYGWVKGKGYPPPKTEWVCRATATFTAENCSTGPSRVRSQ